MREANETMPYDQEDTQRREIDKCFTYNINDITSRLLDHMTLMIRKK